MNFYLECRIFQITNYRIFKKNNKKTKIKKMKKMKKKILEL